VIETQNEHRAITTALVNNTDAVPVTANIRILNVDGDVTTEIVFAEPMEGRIAWIDSECIPNCENLTSIENLGSPVRVAAGDIDGDGINELIVSDIGILFPSNDLAGSILQINTTGEVSVLADGLGRTVCAEPADLDADGDLDLTLCEFGHDDGSVGWLEQENGGWTHHVLDPRPGAIHAIPADIDGDGVYSNVDICPNSPQRWTIDTDGCALPQIPIQWSSGPYSASAFGTVGEFSFPTTTGSFSIRNEWTGNHTYLFIFNYKSSSYMTNHCRKTRM